MNAMRQPNASVIAGTISGARIAPTLEPALNSPIAKVRSRWGNHSATAASAEGKAPDSPSASGMRASANPAVDVTKMQAICPAVHRLTASA